MKPGQNITFTLNGDPYGLAVLRVTDDRLNYIQPVGYKLGKRMLFFSRKLNHKSLEVGILECLTPSMS